MTLKRGPFLLVAIAMAPALAILVYNAVELRREQAREVRSTVISRAERIAAEQQRVIDSVRQVLANLVELPEIRSQDVQACSRLLATIRRQYEGIEALVVSRAPTAASSASVTGPQPCRTGPNRRRSGIVLPFSKLCRPARLPSGGSRSAG